MYPAASSLVALSLLTLVAVIISLPTADAKCSIDQWGNIIEPCRPPSSNPYENSGSGTPRDEGTDYVLWIAAGFLAAGSTAIVFMLRK